MGAALETSNVCRMEDIDTDRPAMLDLPKENPDVQGLQVRDRSVETEEDRSRDLTIEVVSKYLISLTNII